MVNITKFYKRFF